MLDYYSTQATVAKIHALYGKMLSEANFRELMNKQTVGDVAAYLKKNTRYRSVLSTIDVNTIHRGHLEDLIRRCNFDVYVRLCKFQQLNKKDFFNYLIIQEEIDQILSCILHINAGNSEEYISALPSYLIKHSSFDMLELAKAHSFQDILKAVKSTSYFKVLYEIKPDKGERIDYVECELRLRKYFYEKMFEIIDHDFMGNVSKTLKADIKSQIDLINFINSYRYKFYFDASPEAVRKSMLPFFGRIAKKKMFSFYEAKNREEMLDWFSKTSYAKRLDRIDPDLVEHSFYLIRHKNAKSALKRATSAPVALFSFMYLCEIETMNLINIVEGIRYNVSSAYIERLLII